MVESVVRIRKERKIKDDEVRFRFDRDDGREGEILQRF